MSGNPLQDQGTLNLVLASVSIPNFPELNVTAPFLNRAGITLAKEGSATLQLPTMTGAVQSQQPYMLVNVTINLLKTQNLSALYKAQFEDSTLIGDITVRPDVSEGLQPYDLLNCALDSVREQSYAGADAGWAVSLHGYWIINNSLFN